MPIRSRFREQILREASIIRVETRGQTGMSQRLKSNLPGFSLLIYLFRTTPLSSFAKRLDGFLFFIYLITMLQPAGIEQMVDTGC
jgi:hypothetical protein